MVGKVLGAAFEMQRVPAINSFVKTALIVGVLIAEGSLALAQSGGASGTGQNERLICRRMQETGSLVKGRRQCFTKAEWDRIAESQQSGWGRAIDEMRNRPAGGN